MFRAVSQPTDRGPLSLISEITARSRNRDLAYYLLSKQLNPEHSVHVGALQTNGDPAPWKWGPSSMISCLRPSWSLWIKNVATEEFIDIWYDIDLLTASGLPPGGSCTIHIYTQTIDRTIQNKQYIVQHKMWEQHKNFGRVRAVSPLGRNGCPPYLKPSNVSIR
jgi:hypothetical protein